MTIEEQLRHFILAQYKSVRAFSKAVGLPNPTVESILKRGLENASVGNVIKICKFLQISADGLSDGEIIRRELSDMQFTAKERELIKKFRLLDERGQRAVTDTVDREYSYMQPFLEELPNAT